MVRNSAIQPPDDKKEATRKRTPRPKPVVSGVWPCKINGCNKQFAREADLKRHQRTTKLHSMPNFACPQCDATFTRTDALRRHQKSRHNGVVIELSEQEPKEEGDENRSSASQSNSRSVTPSAKGKEKANLSPRSQERHLVQTRTGPSSYYRQHTVTNTTPYVPRPPVIEPHYVQIGPPTSSTRMAHWGYPHPWPDGVPQQMSYQQVYFTPHYRQNEPPLPPGQSSGQAVVGQQQQQQQHITPSIGSTNSIATLSHSHNPTQSTQSTNSNSVAASTILSMSTIDPSLHGTDSATLTEEQVLEITQAAMKVLEAEAERSSAVMAAKSHTCSTPSVSQVDENDDAGNSFHDEDKGLALHDYVDLGRPDHMEHMLTEDGEPMLNPAELLTQESLAESPPP